MVAYQSWDCWWGSANSAPAGRPGRQQSASARSGSRRTPARTSGRAPGNRFGRFSVSRRCRRSQSACGIGQRSPTTTHTTSCCSNDNRVATTGIGAGLMLRASLAWVPAIATSSKPSIRTTRATPAFPLTDGAASHNDRLFDLTFIVVYEARRTLDLVKATTGS